MKTEIKEAARAREDLLRDAMRIRYHEGRMRRGDQSRLAREFNVTPVRVGEVARSLGISQFIGRGPIRRLGGQA